jgi:transglutaminase-like putative cysteine protease
LYVPAPAGRRTVEETVATVLGRIDFSNVNDGYFHVRVNGIPEMAGRVNAMWHITGNSARGVQAVTPVNNVYVAHPLTFGNDTYDLRVLLSTPGTTAATIVVTARSVEVRLTPPHAPFLIPTFRVNYTAQSPAVALARELTVDAVNDVERVAAIYKWITENIKYDRARANERTRTTLTLDDTPDNDAILRTKVGVCFDYASLFAAMCRSLGIPTRMVQGEAIVPFRAGATEYHAWNEVFLTNDGNITTNIRATRNTWVRLDPTFGVNMNDADLARHLRDDRNYVTRGHNIF